MRTPPNRDRDPRDPAPEGALAGSKKPYRAPRFVTYGNLGELALAKGGAKNDGGGVPASKA